MFTLEFEQVEIDYCPGCRGVWLDSGELALVGRRAGALRMGILDEIETRSGRQTKAEPSRRCPVCGKRLIEVRAQGEPGIVVDRCPRGHGLWFDRGELEAVVARAEAEEGNVLARFFADLSGPQRAS